jgi:hypothetical protein
MRAVGLGHVAASIVSERAPLPADFCFAACSSDLPRLSSLACGVVHSGAIAANAGRTAAFGDSD